MFTPVVDVVPTTVRGTRIVLDVGVHSELCYPLFENKYMHRRYCFPLSRFQIPKSYLIRVFQLIAPRFVDATVDPTAIEQMEFELLTEIGVL